MLDINDALISCVKAAGGSKVVGPKLWPDKAPDTAQRALLDCLNPDRAAHLTPDQLVFVFRLARDAGCHDGMDAMCSALSYAPTLPVEPEDERAALQRQFIESTATLTRLAMRIEALAAPTVRRAA